MPENDLEEPRVLAARMGAWKFGPRRLVMQLAWQSGRSVRVGCSMVRAR